MSIRTPRSLAACLIVTAAGGFFAGCSDPVDPPPATNLEIPTNYTFTSRFTAGASSVSYGGQTVRNLQIQDLSSMIAALGKPGATPVTADQLLAIYEYSDAADLQTTTPTGSLPAKVARYSAISTGKKLSDKISGATLVGESKNADALLREWFAIIAQNSQDPTKLGTPAVFIDAQGRHLQELVNKVLMGAVAYYQGTGVYLNGLMTRDNVVAQAKSGGGTEPYTVMEHAWDEAFGYFGAARDYARYSDAQLSGSVSDYVYDTNGDGAIDFTSEYNFAFARYAAKRDIGVPALDLTKKVFDGFLGGRAAISAVSTNDAILGYRAQVSDAWEKVLVACMIHYLNEVKEDLAKLDENSNVATATDYSKHWGEMKGFAWGLQFNPMKKISDSQLAQLHTLLGSAPTYAAAGSAASTAYAAKLESALELLRSVYGFSAAEVGAW